MADITKLNEKIVGNIEAKLKSVFSGYTIYKNEFTSPQSFGVNGGLFDGQYLIASNNDLKMGLLYRINFNCLNILFFRYKGNIEINYGTNNSISFLDANALQAKLQQAKSDLGL